MKDIIESFFDISAQTKIKSKEALREDIINLATIFHNTFKNGGKVIVFGNGGCSGIAEEMAASFIGRFKSGKEAKHVLSLSSNTAMLTTLANDFGFENIYKRQLEGILNKEDIVIGISTSGNSKNIVKAMEYAKNENAFTVSWTGKGGGQLKEISDFTLLVPSNQPSHIESVLKDISAIICKLIED